MPLGVSKRLPLGVSEHLGLHVSKHLPLRSAVHTIDYREGAPGLGRRLGFDASEGVAKAWGSGQRWRLMVLARGRL